MRYLISVLMINLFVLGCVSNGHLNNQADVIPEKMVSTYELALQGDAAAQEKIGEMYHYGEGVPRDFDKAFYWYNLAAHQGYASSQDYLGLFYASGLGARADCKEATNWLKYAYFNGYKGSKRNLVWMLATCEDDSVRDGKLALELAKEDIAEHGATIGRLDNLAAALAETGDFEKAENIQRKLVIVLEKNNQPERLLVFKKRLELYINKMPWRGVSHEDPTDYTK